MASLVPINKAGARAALLLICETSAIVPSFRLGTGRVVTPLPLRFCTGSSLQWAETIVRLVIGSLPARHLVANIEGPPLCELCVSAHTLEQTVFTEHTSAGFTYDVPGPSEPRKCGSALAKRYRDWFTSPRTFLCTRHIQPGKQTKSGSNYKSLKTSGIGAFSQIIGLVIDVLSAEYPRAGFSPTKALREASSASVPPTLGGVDGN